MRQVYFLDDDKYVAVFIDPFMEDPLLERGLKNTADNNVQVFKIRPRTEKYHDSRFPYVLFIKMNLETRSFVDELQAISLGEAEKMLQYNDSMVQNRGVAAFISSNDFSDGFSWLHVVLQKMANVIDLDGALRGYRFWDPRIFQYAATSLPVHDLWSQANACIGRQKKRSFTWHYFDSAAQFRSKGIELDIAPEAEDSSLVHLTDSAQRELELWTCMNRALMYLSMNREMQILKSGSFGEIASVLEANARPFMNLPEFDGDDKVALTCMRIKAQKPIESDETMMQEISRRKSTGFGLLSFLSD